MMPAAPIRPRLLHVSIVAEPGYMMVYWFLSEYVATELEAALVSFSCQSAGYGRVIVSYFNISVVSSRSTCGVA